MVFPGRHDHPMAGQITALEQRGTFARSRAVSHLPAGHRISRLGVAILSGGVYALLVLIMWAPHTLYSGLPFETAFPYMSETRSAIDGFFYTDDPLRIHTNTFYHLSYLLADATGNGGSYVPFQIVHALLWWARGMLTFMLLRRFLPDCSTVAYVAGALVVVHASDGAMQWIGQLNQFGFIFWMLLAWYLLSRAVEARRRTNAVMLTLAASCVEYISLWSYEAQLLLLVLFPLLLWWRFPRHWPRLAAVCMPWYAVPVTYLWLTVSKYLNSSGMTYQESVIRNDWRVSDVLGDWWFNVAASLEFWRWLREGWVAGFAETVILAFVAAALFSAGGIAAVHLARETNRRNFLVSRPGTWWSLLAAGFVLLAASFPVYLLLGSARMLWRTQFLSGIGCAIVLTALFGRSVACAWFVRPAVKLATFILLAAAVVGFGSLSALEKGALHRKVWERHRAAMVHILNVVPSVKPPAMIVLVNVPRDDDPFGHNMWLDLAVRLVYPGIPVSGMYYYADGTPAPGNPFTLRGDRWKWNGSGFPPIVHDTTLANTVVVDYAQPDSNGLVRAVPPFVCREQCAAQLYNPAAVITGPMSPRAIRRYRVDSRS